MDEETTKDVSFYFSDLTEEETSRLLDIFRKVSIKYNGSMTIYDHEEIEDDE